jgi:hypothetical protein
VSSKSSYLDDAPSSHEVGALFNVVPYPSNRRISLGGPNVVDQGDIARMLTYNRSQGLALTASLKAAQVASDLQLLQSTCSTIVTRILIQQALQRFNEGNDTDANWVVPADDVQSALGSGGYATLFQTIIYPKSGAGNAHGLLNVTSSVASPVTLPYKYPNGTVSLVITVGCVKVAPADATSRKSC